MTIALVIIIILQWYVICERGKTIEKLKRGKYANDRRAN